MTQHFFCPHKSSSVRRYIAGGGGGGAIGVYTPFIIYHDYYPLAICMVKCVLDRNVFSENIKCTLGSFASFCTSKPDIKIIVFSLVYLPSVGCNIFKFYLIPVCFINRKNGDWVEIII